MARRVSSPTFVGREQELDRLASLLADAVRRIPSVALVGGEAGIGKTRLVAEFGARARAAGAQALGGRCVPIGGGSPPYAPIVEALRERFAEPDRRRLDRVLGGDRVRLARLLPGIAAGDARTPAGGVADPETVVMELLQVVRRLSSDAPLLFVVEDLHWADRASLDALSYLARTVRNERVLLLGTYRTDDLRRDHPLLQVLAELDRGSRVEWLELARFDRLELDRLLAGILGHRPDPVLAERIHARSGGNPYFAEELLALGAVDGSLPETLREVLLARIDGLAGPTRELLRVASVAGPRFDVRLLGEVRGVPAGSIEVALREAVAHQVLVPLDRAQGEFEFRHALLAEAVYEDMLPTERARLHAAYARCLGQPAGTPMRPGHNAELAHHWLEAGDRPRALGAAVRAAEDARATHAPADALTQLERAVALWPVVPAAETLAGMDLATLHELAAADALDAGDANRAVGHLESAISLTRPDTDPVTIGLLFDRLGSAAIGTGDVEGSVRAHTEAVRLVAAESPPSARARVLAGLARRRMLDGRWQECETVAREAVALARRAAASSTEADALATLGVAQGLLGVIDDALATLQRGRDLAVRVGDVNAATRAWSNLASLQEGEASVQEALAAIAWNDQIGPGRPGAVWARCLGSTALFELGRWQEADALLAGVRDEQLEPTGERFLALCDAQLDLGRGRLDSAHDRLAHARHRVDPVDGDRWMLAGDHLEAQLHLATGELALARVAASHAIDHARGMPLGARTYHALVFATALRIEAELAIDARRRRDAGSEADSRRRGEAIVEVARGLAAEVAGGRERHWRRPAAVAAACEAEWCRLSGVPMPLAWAAAAERCRDAGQHHLVPYLRMRQAEAALASCRDRRTAARLLREALAAAEAMGADPAASAISAVARRAHLDIVDAPSGRRTRAGETPPGGESATPDPLDAFRLTPRERDVLALISAGRTNREIGESLFIGERTAGIHVSRILAKLDVHHRTEAAALVHRLGGPLETQDASVTRPDPGPPPARDGDAAQPPRITGSIG